MKHTFFLFILLILSAPSFAIAPGVTAGMLLSEIENAARQTIKEAERSANNVTNNAAYNLLIAVQQLRQEYEASLEKTSATFTKHEKQVFEGIEFQSRQIFDRISNQHEKLDNSLDVFATYLSDVAFVSDEPRISRLMSDTYIFGSLNTSHLSIEFRGKNLNHEENVISMKGNKITPLQRSDNKLSFRIPESALVGLGFENKGGVLPITVHINKRKWLFLDEEKTYLYRINIVPNEIATVNVSFSRTLTRKVDFRAKSQSGAAGSIKSGKLTRRSGSATFNAVPTSGYFVAEDKPASVDWHGSDDCSGRTSCGTSTSKNQVSASCNIVTEKGGKVTCHYRLEVKFTEYRNEQYVERKKIEGLTLRGNSDLSINAPEGFQFEKLEMVLFTGKRIIHEKPYSGHLYLFERDIQDQSILIKSLASPK